jgi:hypothetical protein
VATMNEATMKSVLELLNNMAESGARVTGRDTTPCPICGMLIVSGQLLTHARAYGDEA